MSSTQLLPFVPGLAPNCGNPLIPGYFADPSLVQYDGKFYVYATLDPWSGDTLDCGESEDFHHWTYRFLNWPTTQACSNPTGRQNKMWALSWVVPIRRSSFRATTWASYHYGL